jgi:hypothetical protein
VAGLSTAVKHPSDSSSGSPVAFLLMPLAYAAVGWLLTTRRPFNIVGWLCALVGVLFTLVALQESVAGWLAAGGHREAAGWVGTLVTLWVPSLGILAILLPLRIPDGQLPSRRWTPYWWISIAVISLSVPLVLVDPGGGNGIPGVKNPLAISSLEPLQSLFVLFWLAFLGAVGSLVVRYQRAGGIERLQLRWIAAGAVAVLLIYAVPAVLLAVGVIDENGPVIAVVQWIGPDGFAILPVTIGVAVLRYRLYELDRILNRAAVYLTLTAALLVLYAGSVLVLSTALKAVTQGSNLAVAGSTLLVAALFRPARTRIQTSVDRHFFRTRYDAQRTLENFFTSVQQEVQIDFVQLELRNVVAEALQPVHVSLWMRHPQP